MQVLDNGYMELVEAWGSDERIIEAARMSTQQGFKGWGNGVCMACRGNGKIIEQVEIWDEAPEQEFIGFGKLRLVGGKRHYEEVARECTCKGSGPKPGDEKLLRYLWTHKHATPFEMAGLTIEVKAPIFVFREWHRHRTQSYNEMSARYAPLPDENYLPTTGRIVEGAALAGKNKQASALSNQASPADAQQWLAELALLYKHAQQVYELGLELGVPKEVARLPCPVARYSKMRASANLRNWLQFLTLRMDTAAQWEIRQYANAVGRLVSELFPRTWALFAEGLS